MDLEIFSSVLAHLKMALKHPLEQAQNGPLITLITTLDK